MRSGADRAGAPARPWPAMVLTAGLGTRLHPLSQVRAKPAVPVAGVPLAGRILRWLAAAGVTDAVLNLHHRPETLTAVLGDGAAYGVRVRYSWERRVLGSAGGPARALPLLDAPRFFLVNGDTLCDVDLAALARQHEARGALVTMVLVPNPDRRHYGGVLVDAGGAVTGFCPRGDDNTGAHFVGVQAVDASVFAGLDPDQPAESVAGCYRELIARAPGSVQAFLTDGAFYDIGTAADYLATNLAFAAREGLTPVAPGRNCSIAPSADLHDCVLWDGVTIGAGCRLRSCVVADGVTVPPGTQFDRRALVRREAAVPRDCDIVMGDLLAAPLDAFRRQEAR